MSTKGHCKTSMPSTRAVGASDIEDDDGAAPEEPVAAELGDGEVPVPGDPGLHGAEDSPGEAGLGDRGPDAVGEARAGEAGPVDVGGEARTGEAGPVIVGDEIGTGETGPGVVGVAGVVGRTGNEASESAGTSTGRAWARVPRPCKDAIGSSCTTGGADEEGDDDEGGDGASKISKRAPRPVPTPWLGSNIREYATSSNWSEAIEDECMDGGSRWTQEVWQREKHAHQTRHPKRYKHD